MNGCKVCNLDDGYCEFCPVTPRHLETLSKARRMAVIVRPVVELMETAKLPLGLVLLAMGKL